MATMSVTHVRAAGDQAVLRTVAIAVLGVLVAYLPIAGVSVALARIGADTGASTSGLQWVSDAYIIPMASLIVSAGVFGDIHGRRRLYIIGMAITVLGAVTAGAAGALDGASSLHLLWGGQALMGTGAGILLPTTLALIGHAVPDFAARSRYIAMWATGLIAGLAVGPLLSGVILEHWSFPWIFAPVVVAAALAAFAAVRLLPESRAPEGRRLDWPGQIGVSIAIATSIYGVIEGGEQGWSSATTLGALTVAAVALVAFGLIERRVAAPAIDLSLFRSIAFDSASIAAVASLFALVGAIFVLSLFFGDVQHLSPLDIGWRLLFLNGPTLLLSPLVGKLMTRVRPQVLLTVGLALGAVAMGLISNIDAAVGLGSIGWRLALLGVATALVLSTVPVTAIHSAAHEAAGMASTTNTVLRQYGGALGPAILGVVLAHQLRAGDSFTEAMSPTLLVAAAVLLLAAVACAVSTAVDRR